MAESVDVSLHRLGTDHLDIILCHDIEFVPMQQIVDETLPAAFGVLHGEHPRHRLETLGQTAIVNRWQW